MSATTTLTAMFGRFERALLRGPVRRIASSTRALHDASAASASAGTPTTKGGPSAESDRAPIDTSTPAASPADSAATAAAPLPLDTSGPTSGASGGGTLFFPGQVNAEAGPSRLPLMSATSDEQIDRMWNDMLRRPGESSPKRPERGPPRPRGSLLDRSTPAGRTAYRAAYTADEQRRVTELSRTIQGLDRLLPRRSQLGLFSVPRGRRMREEDQDVGLGEEVDMLKEDMSVIQTDLELLEYARRHVFARAPVSRESAAAVGDSPTARIAAAPEVSATTMQPAVDRSTGELVPLDDAKVATGADPLPAAMATSMATPAAPAVAAASDDAPYPRTYPRVLAHLIKLARTSFRNPHLALAFFHHARTRSLESYLSGCMTSAYNEYMVTAWDCFRDLAAVAAALREMTANAIAWDVKTSMLINRVTEAARSELDQVRMARVGAGGGAASRGASRHAGPDAHVEELARREAAWAAADVGGRFGPDAYQTLEWLEKLVLQDLRAEEKKYEHNKARQHQLSLAKRRAGGAREGGVRFGQSRSRALTLSGSATLSRWE